MSLAQAGFSVEAVSPPEHPFEKTSVIRRTYVYRGLSPLNSLAEAITAAKPDLIIPNDDLAVEQLHALYAREHKQATPTAQEICALLEKSLGTPASFRTVYERDSFIEVAGKEGIRVPRASAINSIDDLKRCINDIGLPLVLKSNGSSGGDGVRIVRSLDEAVRALRALQAPPLLARAIKRSLADQDRTLIWPSLARRRSAVSAQSFIAGREATNLVACWEGKVLAGLHFEVLNKGISSGPASVLRLIENAEMLDTAEKMVSRLNLSGLHGFDFMIEANTGHAYLIEINPRSTQVGHLTLGPGRDLPAALYSAVTGKEIQEAPKVTEKDTIALFPQEWLRDSESENLKTAYHDVPWEEPELVQVCISKSQKWRSKTLQQERVKAFWKLAGSPYATSKSLGAESLTPEPSKSRSQR
ncbi:MAG TPA: ATP-grasp domain-containing protein [Candidatus Acidoferrum sp.]|jgi:formate-dependent phosphoribosylglycinamide formyltransferase (GAR transformylase)